MSTLSTQPKVHIGNVIRNALVFNFKNWRGEAVDTDALLQTVARLFALLQERQIEYLLVGDIAMLQYTEGRNTEDIDLIMSLSSLKKLPEFQTTSQDANFMRGKFNELKIDILLASNRLFEEVRRHYATTGRFAERDIPCATVEGLLLLKLYSLPSLYRQGNFARVGIYENDIATLIHYYRPQLEPLLDELAHHFSDTDLVAVREITAEIKGRIERFGKSFGENK
jgi:SAM-dependent methyltransferase